MDVKGDTVGLDTVGFFDGERVGCEVVGERVGADVGSPTSVNGVLETG